MKIHESYCYRLLQLFLFVAAVICIATAFSSCSPVKPQYRGIYKACKQEQKLVKKDSTRLTIHPDYKLYDY